MSNLKKEMSALPEQPVADEFAKAATLLEARKKEMAAQCLAAIAEVLKAHNRSLVPKVVILGTGVRADIAIIPDWELTQ